MNRRVLDIGCGPRKVPGAVGVDIHRFPGVNVIADLDVPHWPFRTAAFAEIFARHIIEHVVDPVAFLRVVHRVGELSALVHVLTPPFTSLTSWQDPTHRWHLSAFWWEALPDYLEARTGRFVLVSARVAFLSPLSSFVPRLIIAVLGLKQWEKHFAYMFPARDVVTTLRIEKQGNDDVGTCRH